MRLPLTHITIALFLLCAPLTATAGTIQAEDSVAGVGLTVTLSDFTPQASVEVQLTAPDGTPDSFAAQTDETGTAELAIAGRFAQRAGIYVLRTPNDTSGMTTVLVEPDSMDPRTSALQVQTPRIAADGHETAAIEVTLRDRYGNPLPGRAASVLSGRTTDTIRALTPETDVQGTQHFSFSTRTPGTSSLRAIDLLSGAPVLESATVEARGTAVGGQTAYASPYAAQTSLDGRFFYAQVLPSFDIIDHFEVEAPQTMQPGVEAQKLTVRAVDRSGNTVENYLGTVLFSSTDPAATLPNFGTYTFRERDLGAMTFALALKFRSSGTQTFRVEDANDDRIAGEATIQVGGDATNPGTGTIEITSHKNDDYINGTDILVEGRGPRFANIIVMGGPQDATGATDGEGNFSVPVSLNPAQTDHTIRVRDETGRNDSGPIHLILDRSAEEIELIQFSPEKPDAGTQVLVVVRSTPDLAQVMLRLPAGTAVQETILTENAMQAGSYQGFLTAPDAGTYQPSVIATDRAGNRTEVRTTLTVASTQLPRVENLRIEPREEAIALRWDAVEGSVTGYRLYIGEGPDNFLYTLDTGGPVTQAVVRGLLPDRVYHFAVTALREDLESEGKSTVVTGQPLGISLNVIPEESALQVRWTSLSADLPLSSFVLEYGTDETALSEKRILNGELRDVTLRDLLPGVPYFLRLTPVTVSGEEMTQLSATGKGTPGGTGFHAAPRDEAPFDITLHPGAQLNPPPAVNDVGLPRSAWMAAAGMGALCILWYVRRKQSARRTDRFLQAVSARYHS